MDESLSTSQQRACASDSKRATANRRPVLLGAARALGREESYDRVLDRRDRKGPHAIKSWTCGKVLFPCSIAYPKLCNIDDGDGNYPNNWSGFIQDDRDKGSFRSAPDLTLDDYDVGLKYDDQPWRFVLVN